MPKWSWEWSLWGTAEKTKIPSGDAVVICKNCKAENEKKAKYCWNCGYKPRTPPVTDKPLWVGDAKFEVDEAGNELHVVKIALFRTTRKRIPLSKIEAVRLYVIAKNGMGLGPGP